MNLLEVFEASVSSAWLYGDEPHVLAGERRKLLAQVKHRAAEAVDLPDQHTSRIRAGRLAFAPLNPASMNSTAGFHPRRQF